MSGEFPAAAATNKNVDPSQNSAFAAALQRAKQIAAKITPSSVSTEAHKRSIDDSYIGESPDVKKPAILSCGLNNSNSSNSPAAIAAAQASIVNARVAANTSSGVPGVGTPGIHLGGPISTKDIKVPDKMVGLIIGRGGEQITRLQAESGCKIQMASDSTGMSDRLCTLAGNTQSIAKAEELISQIIQSRSREMMSTNGSASPSMSMNPGSRTDSYSSSGLPPAIPTLSSPSFVQVEIMVPGPKVGLIIGKGGETIKQLQEKSGAKMVVIQDGPSQEAEKPLRISGEPSKVEHAKNLVYEFMAEKDQQLQGRRTGGYNQNSNRSWDADVTESSIQVPAGKCGVIIGKGGETIKHINMTSGAHCEIDRRQPANVQEKTFIIKGTPDQIDHAKRLFSEKLNMEFNRNGNSHNGHYGMQGGNMGGGMSGYNGGGGQWPNAPGSNYQQSWANNQNPQQMQQHSGSGGPGATGAVNINPHTGQPDYSAQWVEYYKSMGMMKEAATIEEQAKASKGMSSGGQMPMQPISAAMSMPGQQNVSALSQQPGQGDQAGAAPDYSAQWAQYYRSLGKVQEAEAIEANMKKRDARVPAQSAQSAAGMVSSQPNASVPAMYNQQQAAMAAAQYSMGGFPTSGTNQNYYGAAQPQGSAPQYAYPNYGAYTQQPSSNDAHQ